MTTTADLILHNGRITTLDPSHPEAKEVVVAGGRIAGVDNASQFERGPETKVVDLGGRRVIPGLYDSHLHVIRGGLNYNMELRWEGVPSLALALEMLRDQAARTPAPQWVRVVGGWSEFQFAERRMPTLDEINAAAPDTPVFVLHLYCRALLNRAALRACGYTKDTPDPPGGTIVRDKAGNPTGMLIAKPNATILYATLAKGPKLPPEYQYNSTRHFMRELNRLGVTSVCDAGGGFQNYPEDYEIIRELHARGEMTLRIAYNLFTQKAGAELEDFVRWSKVVKPGDGDDMLRCNGAGEMLVFSAADFEDFLEPRPDLPEKLESELERVVRFLAENQWPFRLHATYDESISRFLSIFEKVHRDVPLDGLHWFFDHCETITDRNIERVKALGGGIAVQHRMAFQGEYFVDRYGAKAAERTPPLRRMLELGVPVGAGTDATRVASYNPFVSLYWMTTGKTLGGLSLYPEKARLTREEALRLYTQGSTWMSREQGTRGAIAPGQLADLAVLTADYFKIPDEEIKALESVLTILGGKPVYAAEEFKPLDPGDLPVMPDWSPVHRHPGAFRQTSQAALPAARRCMPMHAQPGAQAAFGLPRWLSELGNLFDGACDCFAF
ncbi:amidohydrolase [Polyangium jinanense]|uniref:Amidohydrolase n=1 Tax=Polyangium jinanense TaxID=2829994 RepID=A0A9X3XCV8_9BACT|nr:amidohydrolase [Polyangium jinanense]MDC3959775.1 amidohydrolase [Polyangium jinanense]MDC3988079.1 amidohydrolase [Polyangium jinanense]